MAVHAADLLDRPPRCPTRASGSTATERRSSPFRGRGIGYVSSDGRYLYVKSTLPDRTEEGGAGARVRSIEIGADQ